MSLVSQWGGGWRPNITQPESPVAFAPPTPAFRFRSGISDEFWGEIGSGANNGKQESNAFSYPSGGTGAISPLFVQ
jgi:hypothetical protein